MRRRQAIIWTNAGILWIRPLEKISEIFNQNPYIFIQENAIQNVVWKMAAILSRPQCVNTGLGQTSVYWDSRGQAASTSAMTQKSAIFVQHGGWLDICFME